jgi:hypothetical protein
MAVDKDFVADSDQMGRLGQAAVDQDATCLANFLSQRPTRAETTRFEEEIEAHLNLIVLSAES